MIKAVIFDMYETLITLFNSTVYKGRQIAEDLNLPEEVFREIWDPTDDDRTLGKMSFEEVISEIMQANDISDQDLYGRIISKRYSCTAEVFSHMHPDIIPMLESLRVKGIRTGLITNCYFEERDAIRDSGLASYFDAVCMSCEEGIKKPDLRIYELCAGKLGVMPGECLYVGDGGSNELEAAKAVGMKPLQATWYLREGLGQPCGRLDEFDQAAAPMDVVRAAEIMQRN